MANWHVNTEASLRNAVKNSSAGDTILVAAGDYHLRMQPGGRYDIKVDHSLTIAGDGGRANFYADGIKVEKGIFNLVLSANETVNFDQIGFFKAHSGSWNGAGIRQTGGNLTVNNSYFADSDTGILSITRDAAKRGDVTVTNSEFSKLGFAGTHAHALYVLADNFTVENNNIHDTLIGHHVKSVSANTIVRNNVLDDGAGTSSYAVDVGAGGDVLISGNTIIQGINGENPKVISYQAVRFGGVAGDVVIDNNHIINLNGMPLGSKVFKNTTESVAVVTNNSFEGFVDGRLFTGKVSAQNNTLDGKLLGGKAAELTVVSPMTGLTALTADNNITDGVAAITVPENIIQGEDFSERIQGSQDGDLIFGLAGNDSIYARGGNDIIFGGAGADYLLGEGGSDMFVLDAFPAAIDKIWDFSAAQGDQINLSSMLETSFDPLFDALEDFVRFVQSGDNSRRYDLQVDRDGLGQDFDFATAAQIQGSLSADLASMISLQGWDFA